MTVAAALAEPSRVLAHGGGAPEAAMIGLPLLLFGVFLLLDRRARKAEAADEADGGGTKPTEGTT